MKQKQYTRYGLALLFAVSLFSILYVNIDATTQRMHVHDRAENQGKMLADDKDRNNTPNPTSGVVLITRVLELLQRLVSNAPGRY